MGKYLKKGFLFSIPILIYFLMILIIDPYEFINGFRIISSKDKLKVINRCDESSPRGNILWKSIHFKRNPVPNLIIGDSQGKRIDTEAIKNLTGEDYFNFCVPGSSYETMFSIFWDAVKTTKLKKVYFQLAFMNFNSFRSYNLYHFAEDYHKEPYRYFTTKEIFFDTYSNLYYQLTADTAYLQRSYEYEPLEYRDKLSEERLKLFFSKYEYPESFIVEFEKIADYCELNNIKLNFLIFPSYKKVDEYLIKKGLQSMEEKFKNDLKAIGKTFDYDVAGSISDERDNFLDYFHPKMHLIDEFTKRTWGND
jgi:hypothetical protein